MVDEIPNEPPARSPKDPIETEGRRSTIDEPLDTLTNDTYTTEVTGADELKCLGIAVKSTLTISGMSIKVTDGSICKGHANCTCSEEDKCAAKSLSIGKGKSVHHYYE